MAPEPRALRALLDRQDSAATTAQLMRLGANRPWIDRRVASGMWQRPHRGVVITYSGPPTWRARFRAALLYAGPEAVLSHEATGFLHGFRTAPPATVTVTVPAGLRATDSPGLTIVRSRRLPNSRPSSGGVPPGARTFARTSFAETALDLASRAVDADGVVAALSEAVRGRTPPAEIAAALAARPNQPNRRLLLDMLTEVAEGVESPLELRYRRLARRHGLPPAVLQVRHRLEGRRVRADCVYRGRGVRVELDGGLGHPGGRTDKDTWRDNAVGIEHLELTLRYRWAHVAGRPCDTAAQVATALRSRGWAGAPRPCGPHCPVLVT